MQSLSWYVNRLGRMSPAEIVHRAGKAGQLALVKLGIGQPGKVPPPDLARGGAQFLATNPAVDVATAV
ncbi:MAG: hypothetical protein ABW136_04255, partial [Steroidobacteraceae bacterium]